MKRRALFLALAALLLLAAQAPAQDLKPRAWGDFDQYVLALTWQPGFCRDMQEAGRGLPVECEDPAAPRDPADNLTLHGLWPSQPRSIRPQLEERDWNGMGCAYLLGDNDLNDGDKCDPRYPLRPDTRQELARVMPGANESTCLEHYEFAKHGVCFNFDPDAYFLTAARLDREVKASALGKFLRGHAGAKVRLTDFRAALEAAYGKTAAREADILCAGRGNASFVEIRLPILRDRVNAPLSAASFGRSTSRNTKKQCGASFLLPAH